MSRPLPCRAPLPRCWEDTAGAGGDPVALCHSPSAPAGDSAVKVQPS